MSYHLNEVAGFDQLQDGSATTLSGVDASDPNTLRVTLSAPDCEFALRTAAPPLSPVPTVAGPANNTAYNDLPIGNGPFTMDGPWRHDTGIRLVRNDTYGAGPKANLDAVELTITPPDTGMLTEYNGFLGGQFDWARMPVPVQAQARVANEPKNQARNDLYKQAEKIAIGDDLGVIPMFARQQFRLVNTTTFGNVNMDFWENPTLPDITLR